MASASAIASSITGIWGANDEESTVDTFLDTGLPELNFALSSDWGVEAGKGGLPVGRMVEIYGPPSAGKTAIATEAMAAAQKAGGVAIFMDHERSFSLRLAPRLGLDTTPGRFLFKKPKTFEASLGLVVAVCQHIRANKLIPPSAPICAVFDSLASMVPHTALYDLKSGKEKAPEERNMNDNTALARATSAHFPAFAQWCEELGICAIFLNQTRTKLGVMYGDPTTTPGGDSPKFYFSIRLGITAQKIKGKTSGDILGMLVTGKCMKNKVVRPFMTASWRFMFQADGTGKFDKVRSTIDFLIREKVLANPGGRIEWQGKKFFVDALAEHIEENKQWGDLCKLLPVKYEPAVIAEVEVETEEAA